jgi:hypothetical protein
MRDAKAVARLAERVLDGHSDVAVDDLAVRRPPPAAVPEDRHRRDLDPGCVGRDDDLRCAPVRLRLQIRHRHDNPERRALRPRREPLSPADDPLVAVPLGARAQRRRVRAGHVRLRHGEERAHLACDERCQPAPLLLLGAEEVEDLAVPCVGRLAAEDELRPHAPPDLLVQVGVDEEALSGAAGLRRQVRRPEAGILRSPTQLRCQRIGLVVLAVEHLLGRIDVLLHERPVALPQLVEARRWGQFRYRHGV